MRVVLVLLGLVVILAGCVQSGAGSPGATGSPVASSPAAASPEPTPTPLPSSTPTPAPTPTAHPTRPSDPTPSSTGSAGLSFEQVAAVEGAELYAAAAFDGGFVVGGCRLRPPSSGTADGGCVDAVIAFSNDGRTWSSVVLPDSAGKQVLGFGATPLGLLAFGSKPVDEPPSTRAIWRSTDGIRWESLEMPAPPSIVFHQAFVLAGRTVLIGEDTAYDLSVETEVWTTADGWSWTNGETPMFSKVAAEPGIVAVGDGCVDVCPERLPIRVSRSADGLEWAEDGSSAELAAGDLWSLGTWAGRAVVAGTVGGDPSNARAAVWFDEPSGWRVSRLPGGAGYVVDMLIDAEDRLIALGATEDGRLGPAWWTADGRTWERGAVGDLAPDAFIAASAGSHPLLLVVDYRSIWLSAD